MANRSQTELRARSGMRQHLSLPLYLGLLAALGSMAGASCSGIQPEIPASVAPCESAAPGEGAPICGYRIVRAYPHDPAAFTQGLAYENGALYESTGLLGQSSLRKVDLETGRVLQAKALSPNYFGEGITIFDDRIIQLTLTSGTGFVYHKESFSLVWLFHFPPEGWGLTHDGQRLIMSDGSATLRFLDPQTFEETGRLEVTDAGRPVSKLNELEYVRGEIYANVWQTDRIARISPETGEVLGWIDLTGILSEEDRTPEVNVLNGTAYDTDGDRLFVTGKRWPKLFEIELVPQRDP